MQIQKLFSMAAMEPFSVDRLRYSELCSTTSAKTPIRLKLCLLSGAQGPRHNKREQDGGLHLHFRLQGLPLEAFIGRLKVTGVQAVLDVRANPLSRKPGFSKTAFSTALNGVEIIYAHFPAMGCPKPVRDRYKRDGDANLCHSMCRSFSSDNSNGVMIRL